jgi:alkanesulfonate monooxygenase SsuD/methylene tetrahydromethanopterin reductase-like flavin-dependent oxidoreductase (luciferase family)
MSFGIMLPVGEGSTFGDPAPTFVEMLEMVRAASSAGFEFVWLADHFSGPPVSSFPAERHSWEAMTMMAGLAAATRDLDIHYGPLVACTSFRNPGLLAKIAEAIDEISGGKFVLGLGAGWHKPEFDAYGYPFDHRVSRFEEAIAIIASLLREGHSTFSGT